jgi:lipopolysaccharide transport system permease protein
VSVLRELVAHRDVLWVLVWRDLKARYRGSILGFLWTFGNPLLLMTIYSLVFAIYMRIDVPAYPLFVFAGLLPWMWFSSAVSTGSQSIIDGGSFIKRAAFPPQILPAVTVIATLVNFVLALPLLFVFMLWYGRPIGWEVLTLPAPIVIELVFTLGLTTLLSVLTVRFRDLAHLVGHVLMLWFFLTPVLYPISFVPRELHAVLALNPMMPVIVAFQDVLYHGRSPGLRDLTVGAALALSMLALAMAVCARRRWTVVEEV